MKNKFHPTTCHESSEGCKGKPVPFLWPRCRWMDG